MLIEKQRENLKNKKQELQKSIHITRHETGSTEYRPLWPYEEEKKKSLHFQNFRSPTQKTRQTENLKEICRN